MAKLNSIISDSVFKCKECGREYQTVFLATDCANLCKKARTRAKYRLKTPFYLVISGVEGGKKRYQYLGQVVRIYVSTANIDGHITRQLMYVLHIETSSAEDRVYNEKELAGFSRTGEFDERLRNLVGFN